MILDTSCKFGISEFWRSVQLRKAYLILLLLGGLGVSGTIGIQPGLAQSNDSTVPTGKQELRPDPAPIDLSAIESGKLPPGAVTSTTISPTSITIPSLWWARDQYAAQEQFGSKLVSIWVAYPGEGTQPGRVDFVVNRQLWSLLDYLQRYSFIHEFGTVATGYGYNMRIFDDRSNFLGAYTCDFSPVASQMLQHHAASGSTFVASNSPVMYSPFTTSEQPLDCATLLDFNGKSSLRGRPTNSPLGVPSSTPGTGQQ